jgi:hypothetical protein
MLHAWEFSYKNIKQTDRLEDRRKGEKYLNLSERYGMGNCGLCYCGCSWALLTACYESA